MICFAAVRPQCIPGQSAARPEPQGRLQPGRTDAWKRSSWLSVGIEHFVGDADVRRCVLHRFPHLVIYRHKPEEILVVAVSHARRKPFYWLERLA
jgi:ParE toxin of type II toxin-antitoxin system, parDE